jgi:hypothetical protein
MKNKLNVLTGVIVLCGLILAGKYYFDWQTSIQKTNVLLEQYKKIANKEKAADKLKNKLPVEMDDVYQRFVNDMYCGARVFRLGVSMDGGIPLFTRSSLDGLREARVKIKFTGIPRRGSLLSLLRMLDASARERPFLVEKMVHEKDTLTMNVLLVGI